MSMTSRPRGPAAGHDGLTEIEPRSEFAVIAWAELVPRRTVMVDVPTTVCVLSRYATDPGTVSVIGPSLVLAVTDRGAAENVATTPPALELNDATGERRSTAVISPAPAWAVTVPEREVSVTAPAPVLADTATPAGTWTL
jgi:hypothetical protein